MSTFLDLQNGFYNALSQGLGYPPGSPFQIFQPSTPLPHGTSNTTLWAYLNNIPPFSLTQNYIASGGNQFFSDYSGLLSALQAPANTFQQDVGEACFNAFQTYINNLSTPPAPQQLPVIFRNWAILRYPSVANKGASDLSAMLLEPISAGQMAIMPYQGGRPADWSLNYSDLISQLNVAPKVSFQVNSSTMNSKVTNSWTQGSNEGFFGLWGGSHSTTSQSATFAAGGVTLTASFAHVITFSPAPGNWYNSSTMGDAYSNQASPPWIRPPDTTITWQNTFGSNGNMQRFAVNLIVVSEMSITVTSVATFSSADQQTIHNNSGAGLWPFYCSSSSSGASTTVSFNKEGQMTVHITSIAGVPIVIGCNVLPVAQYVGHAVEGARIFATTVTARRAAAAAG
jgi:hypothetical protein